MATTFSGKSVIVTGAASGIGLATARRFVQAGASVMLADLDEDKLEKEVETLNGEGYPGQALSFHGDLREKLTLNNLVAATVDAFEGIDVLINAVRTVVSTDPLNIPEDELEAVLHLNVVANLRLSQLVAKRMIEYSDEEVPEPRDRAIVNITSVLARRSLPKYLAFAVSAAAVEQATRTLALALSGHQIRVNAVAVGGLISSAFSRTLAEIDELNDSVREIVPLGRLGEYNNVADAALFLSSPASSFTTGQILTVDGGRLLLDPLEAVFEQ